MTGASDADLLLRRDSSATVMPAEVGKPCVCYVLSYRAPDYIRTLSLLRAMKLDPSIRLVCAMNTHHGPWRYVETWRALRRVRAVEKPDVYFIGFRGHEIFWWIRKMIHGKPLIFDALMSPYAALSEEGKGGVLGRWLAPLVYRLERHALQHSNSVLTDTRLHADFYSRTFGLPEDKIVAVPVGAVESRFVDSKVHDSSADAQFSVLFYGSFLALHGIDVIVSAASKLKDCPIRFDFVGGRAKQIAHLHGLCARLAVVRYTHRKWIPFERLLSEVIPRATLCLGGPFGGTAQGRRVVTGKASQCLALGKVTVVGAIDEDYGFENRNNCLVVEQGDADSLARAIRWAYGNPQELDGIGQRGRSLYEQRLSTRIIGKRLSHVFQMLGISRLGEHP